MSTTKKTDQKLLKRKTLLKIAEEKITSAKDLILDNNILDEEKFEKIKA